MEQECPKAQGLRPLEEILSDYTLDLRFEAADICRMHKIWLGGIYQWAGMDYDYAPMEEIFTGVIERTLKLRSQP